MNTTLRPLAELSEEATTILIREMGIVDALRFLSQMRPGSGNYAKDRGEWLNDLSLGEITSAIKSKRPKKRRTEG
jgi:hypothetical protein